ncbi:MAG TPA: type IIL restriction-modification enzyme MmeI, partial [Sphingomonas sp.]|nr:type IIL restriction-modification enzyme MmeI [Sphingomonas sp.]
TQADAAHVGWHTRLGASDRIRPYRNGRDLLQQSRDAYAIDLFGLSELEVRQKFPEIYQHLLVTVKPERNVNRRSSYRERWWLFGESRSEIRPALEGLHRYIATPVTAKYRMFTFIDGMILADDALVVVACDDAVLLGILSSLVHTCWAAKVGGTLEDRSRYNRSKIFDPFPFPDPTSDQRTTIADLAEELDATRKAALAEHPRLTMTGLYNLVEKLRAGATLSAADEADARDARARIVRHLHDQIDAAVAAAYGWPADLAPAEIVARLVALNAERAAEEAAGHVRWLRPDYQIPRFAKDAAKRVAPAPAEPPIPAKS